MLAGAPGASYGLTAMEFEGIATTEEHDKHSAKVFALGVRNSVEDPHAGCAFHDGQAPLLNRFTRRYIYEALLALSPVAHLLESPANAGFSGGGFDRPSHPSRRPL